MNELVEALVDGLIDREEDCESSIKWNGKDYPCSGGAEFSNKVLGPGGFKLSADVAIVIRTAVFPDDLPAEKQGIIYTSSEDSDPIGLRIDSITKIFAEVWVLQCNHVAQGA